MSAAEHERVFALLDRLDNAKGRIKGTAAVMESLIEAGDQPEDVAATITRWLRTDSDELEAAFEAAFHGILDPLRAAEAGKPSTGGAQ